MFKNLRDVVAAVILPVAVSTAYVHADSSELVLLDSPRAQVTLEDIERYIEENLPQDENQRGAVLNRSGIYKEMVESLYVMRALAKEAEAAPGFDEEQARWAAEMAYQRKAVSNYRQRVIEQSLQDVNWDVAALEQYNANPEKFMQEEAVSASHILVKTDTRSEEEARMLVSKLRDRILAGEDFVTLAQEYSEDGTARRGGSLGFFSRGKMTPEFEKSAFALREVGDVSEPVKTPFGYHLIKLDGRKEAGMIPFKQVKQSIVGSLRTQMGNQLWQDKIIRLRSAKDIEMNTQAIKALQDARPSLN